MIQLVPDHEEEGGLPEDRIMLTSGVMTSDASCVRQGCLGNLEIGTGTTSVVPPPIFALTALQDLPGRLNGSVDVAVERFHLEACTRH